MSPRLIISHARDREISKSRALIIADRRSNPAKNSPSFPAQRSIANTVEALGAFERRVPAQVAFSIARMINRPPEQYPAEEELPLGVSRRNCPIMRPAFEFRSVARGQEQQTDSRGGKNGG